MRLVLTILMLLGFSVGIAQKLELGLPLGHNTKVNSLAFSPDDKLVLTSSWDNTAKVWDTESGFLIHTLNHSNQVKFAKFSSNGDKIVTCSWDNTAKLWDTKTGTLIWEMQGHDNAVNSAEFSPDEKFVITASSDYKVKVWNLVNRELEYTFDNIHNDFVTSAKFSPDGKRIVSAAVDGTVVLWDFENRSFIKEFSHGTWVRSVEFSRDEKFILTASWDSTCRLWDANNGDFIMGYLHENDRVESAVFLDDGFSFLSVSDNGVKLWNIDEGLPIGFFKPFNSLIINSGACTKDNEFVMASNSEEVMIWHIESGIEHFKWGIPSSDYFDNTINKAILSNNENKILMSFENGLCKIVDLESGEEVNLSSKVSNIERAIFSYDNEYIITYSRLFAKGNINLWSFKTGNVKKNHESNSGIRVLEKSPVAPEILVGYNDGLIRIWNYETDETKVLERGSYPIIQAKYSPDGNRLITKTLKETIKLWDVPSGELIYERDGIATNLIGIKVHIEFSPDSEHIIIGDKTPYILVASTGELLHDRDILYGDDEAYSSFSPNNDLVLTTTWSDSLRIWKKDTGELIRKIDAHDGNYITRSAIFSPNSKHIITTSDDNTAKLWDVNSGNLLKILEGHTENVEEAKYSYDSSRIMTIAEGGTIKIWKSDGKFLYTLKGHTNDIASAEFSLDNKYILSSSVDGKIIIWDSSNGSKIIQKMIFNDNKNFWVHLRPNGLFDISDEAKNLLYWKRNLELYSFEELQAYYYEPGLWKKVFDTNYELPKVPNINDISLPPKVNLLRVKNNSVLPIEISKREGGYGNLEIYINGILRADLKDEINQDKQTQVIDYKINTEENLSDGENVITVISRSSDGIVQSKGVKKRITNRRDIKEVNFYSVMIGIADYPKEKMKLKFPVDDVHKFHSVLTLGAKNLYKDKFYSYKLVSNHPNQDSIPYKKNIVRVFEDIQTKSKPDDIVFIYYSGHGYTLHNKNESNFLFLTQDATADDPISYKSKFLRENQTLTDEELDKLLFKIKANKRVIIIDACGSGKYIENQKSGIDPSRTKILNQMAQTSGFSILAGSSADKDSYESSVFGHGILTYSLLEGIKTNSDEKILSLPLMQYAQEQVPKLAQKVNKIQEPTLLGNTSIALGLFKSSDQDNIKLLNEQVVMVLPQISNADSDIGEDDFGLGDLLREELVRFSDEEKSPIKYINKLGKPTDCKIIGKYNYLAGKFSLKYKISCDKVHNETLLIESNNAKELIKLVISELKKYFE